MPSIAILTQGTQSCVAGICIEDDAVGWFLISDGTSIASAVCATAGPFVMDLAPSGCSARKSIGSVAEK